MNHILQGEAHLVVSWTALQTRLLPEMKVLQLPWRFCGECTTDTNIIQASCGLKLPFSEKLALAMAFIMT